jgi:hypothetical protein
VKATFYAFITRNGAVRTTRRNAAQSKAEVKIRLVVEIPDRAWEPEGTPTANISVPLGSLVRPPVELTVEAVPATLPERVQFQQQDQMNPMYAAVEGVTTL